jgi:hypothetical protein
VTTGGTAVLVRIITKGFLVATVLVMAGVLLMGHHATTTGTPALIGTSDQWRTGPSFYLQSNCYNYGAQQAWLEWQCRDENGVWVYHYRVPAG